MAMALNSFSVPEDAKNLFAFYMLLKVNRATHLALTDKTSWEIPLPLPMEPSILFVPPSPEAIERLKFLSRCMKDDGSFVWVDAKNKVPVPTNFIDSSQLRRMYDEKDQKKDQNTLHARR